MERDYLILYEEPDEGEVEDRLTVNVEASAADLQGSVDVQTDFGVESVEKANALGLIGLIVAVVGAVMGIAAVIWFGVAYPDAWYGDDGTPPETGVQRSIAVLASLSFIVLMAGNLMTYYGRTTKSDAVLNQFALVEHVPKSQLRLRDDE
ncbi:MAG: hypothetical protein ACPGQL_05225 [Thermoplasmatota archaeon]